MMISVIIPVRNASEHIRSTLRRVIEQDYPVQGYEIIVADGASEDSTVSIVREYEGKFPLVRILALAETGRSQGLNAAIRAAKGEYICRLDARTQLPTDYLRRCVEVLERTGAANVAGLQVTTGRGTRQRAIGWAMTHPFGAGNAKFKTARQSGYVDSVYLGFFRRAVLEEVGYYDESGRLLSEDSDLNERIRKAGHKIYLDVNLKVGYEPRDSLLAQGRLYVRYGMARVGSMKKNRQLTSWRQLPAPGLVAALLVLPGLAFFHGVFFTLWVIILVMYTTVDTMVSAWICWRERCAKAFPFLWATFPLMHLAWGWGFWRALFARITNDREVIV